MPRPLSGKLYLLACPLMYDKTLQCMLVCCVTEKTKHCGDDGNELIVLISLTKRYCGAFSNLHKKLAFQGKMNENDKNITRRGFNVFLFSNLIYESGT